MPAVYVAIGSNVDPERNLARALAELARLFPGMRASAWYRNRAVGFSGADFVNAVVGFETDLSLEEVLGRLHAVEALCGRARDAPKWAPRAMDLDVLLYGDRVCEGPPASLPRPDLLKRAYMLGPLAEIAPGVRHPTAQATIAELWNQFDRAAHPMVRVFPPGAAADAP